MPDNMTTDPIESRWKLRNLKVDTIVKIVSPVAVVVAALVAFLGYRAHVQQDKDYDVRKSLLDLKVDIDAIPTNDKQSVLIVNVHLDNVGKQTIFPYTHADTKEPYAYIGEGCTLSITRHDISMEGRVAYDGDTIVPRYNILERYDYSTDRPWHHVYVIKPETHYRETEAIVVENGYLYEAVVRFYGQRDDDAWTVSETKYVFVK